MKWAGGGAVLCTERCRRVAVACVIALPIELLFKLNVRAQFHVKVSLPIFSSALMCA